MSDVRSVALGFWVGAGSIDEPDSLAGASHFLEHLLFKGTDRWSARGIAEAIDEVGGDMNAFTTKEYTAFYVRVLSESVGLGLDILSDIIWSPAFRQPEIDAERQVIIEEILMQRDEPAELVHEVLAGALFPDHPLGREVLGEEPTVAQMDRDAISHFHRHHYRPGNIVVAGAGLLDHDAVVEAVSSAAGERTGGGPPVRRGPGSRTEPTRIVESDTEQAHIAIGVRGLARGDEDRYALSIVDHVLGGGMSSRLFQSIREERGLAYSVFSYRMGFEQTGAFTVYAGTAPGKATEVRRLIEDAIDEMARNGPTDAEFAAARSHIRGATALGLEDSSARMSRIGRSQLVHGRVDSIDELDAHLAALTPSDVRDVARRVLDQPRTLAAVGPFGAGGLELD